MTAKRKLSDEEREHRRAQERERLKEAAAHLLTSEGWRRWMIVRSHAGLARLVARQPAARRTDKAAETR